MQLGSGRTRYHIARIHGVLVLDEAEAIHELDLRNFAGAMGVEVILNIGLCSYIHMVQSAMPGLQAMKRARARLRLQVPILSQS